MGYNLIFLSIGIQWEVQNLIKNELKFMHRQHFVHAKMIRCKNFDNAIHDQHEKIVVEHKLA